MEDRTHAVKLERKLSDWIVLFACASVALVYLYTAKFGQLPVFQQRGIILVFGLSLILFKYPALRRPGRRPVWAMAVDVVLAVTAAVAVYDLATIELKTQPGFYHMTNTRDIVLGTLLIVTTIEATRRVLGWVMPILALVTLAYAVFGANMPGILRHSPLDFEMMVYYVSLSQDGIFGVPLYAVSTFVIAFVLFAAVMGRLGLMEFFIDVASGLFGKYRGGPAKIAVLSSAFLATISGSAVANVVGTGSFTIPLMKRIGYRPDFAGAVEACASTGGVTTPPVMGAAAFIMAEYLGISYWAVCVAAFLPAFLYYVGVYVGVDLEAMRSGLRGLTREQLPSVRKAVLTKGYMLAPILVLVYYMGVVRGSAMLAAFWAIVSTLVVAVVTRSGRKNLFGLGLVEALAQGIKDSLVVVATCATAGIIIGILIVTGLSMRLGTILIMISGGNLVVLLMLTAVVCIILGMGITLTAIYILMAMVVAPSLVKLGVPPLAAHLFVLYLANLSNITPPVAVAVFAACGISGGRPLSTGWIACRLGAVLFLVPFFFAFEPSLILQGPVPQIVLAAGTAMIGVVALSSGMFGYSWWGALNWWLRMLWGLGGLALIYPTVLASTVGGGLVAVALLYQLRQRRGVAAAELATVAVESGGKPGGEDVGRRL